MGGSEFAKTGELNDCLDAILKEYRQHDDAARHRLEETGANGRCVRGQIGDEHAPLLERALPYQSFAEPDALEVSVLGVGEGREQDHAVRLFAAHLIEHALLCVDQRSELGEQHAANGGEVALPLQHAGEASEVGLEPVLLGVAVGGQPQVVDHGVDVVFELGDLTKRIDLNGAGKVAFGHSGCDFRDGAYLVGEVVGGQVHVSGEVLPCSRCAGHVRLSPEAAFHTDLAGHGSDLIGKGGERVGHVVDGLGERSHFALGIDGELLRELAVGDSGDYLHNAAYP